MAKEVKDIKERTFEFALRIIKLCQHLDKKAGVSRTLSYQLLKAGTSVGANVEEAQAGQSRPDFIRQELHRVERSTRMPLLVETAYRREDHA